MEKTTRDFNYERQLKFLPQKLAFNEIKSTLISPIPGFPEKIAHISELSW